MSSTTLRPRDPAAAGAPGVLAEASRLVGELREVLWAARNAGEKAETVAAIEVLKSTLHALELDVVRDLEATHAVQHLGWASTADFVTAVAGGHKGAGPATVRLRSPWTRHCSHRLPMRSRTGGSRRPRPS
jgi:hypothetical protein